MSANISTLNVLLTGSVDGFTAACNAGVKSVEGFAHSVTSALGSVEGLFAGLGLGLSVAGFAAMTKASIDNVAALSRQAAATGVTTEAMSRLSYAASQSGVDGELLSTSLGKLLKNTANAAEGTGDAEKAFQRLGLSAKELSGLSPEKSFEQIAEALKGVANPYEKAQLAQDIFGKSAKGLIPLLDKGADGIQALSAEADRLGITINSVDAKEVEAAHEAMGRLEKVVQAVANQIAIRLAPYIEAAAKNLVDFGTQGHTVGDLVTSAFESVAKGVAIAADYLSLLKAGFYGLEGVISAVFAGGVIAIDGMAHAIAKLAELLGKKIDTTFVDSLADNLKSQTVEYFDKAGKAYEDFAKGTASKSVTSYFDRVRADAKTAAQAAVDANSAIAKSITPIEESVRNEKEIAKTLDELQTKVTEFGKSEGQQLADKLKKLGANDKEIAQATELADTLDKLNAKKKEDHDLDEQAKKIIEESKSPFDKYQDGLAQLDKLYATNRLNAEQYANAQAKLEKDFEKSDKTKNVKSEGPKLLSQNSNEAFKVISEIQNRAKGLGDKTAEKQLAESKKHSKFLADIANAAKKDGKQKAPYARIGVV